MNTPNKKPLFKNTDYVIHPNGLSFVIQNPNLKWETSPDGTEAYIVEKEVNIPNYTRCSVCHTVYVNGVGSTPCCGGMNEGLYEDEVTSLGIDVDKTRNNGDVRPSK